MVLISSLAMMSMFNVSNPISMAIHILFMSILSAILIFKFNLSSWTALVTVLTFSSGMMTLFMYTASLSSNEKNKNNKKKLTVLLPLVLIFYISPSVAPKMYEKNVMSMFSSKLCLAIMMTVILITMTAVSLQGHHPYQTLTTSF